MRLRKAMLFLGAAASLGVVAPAMAQDQAPTIGEIVVTARRMEERLQDVPISITVFNQQQLTERNITHPGDLALYTPSLQVDNQFGSDNTAFSLRGFSQDLQTSPTVGVYFADVVAPRGGPTVHTGDGAGPGSFFDLQNVQVLKGPQGTLFGRNTTGGAVLLVPVKPTDRYEGYIEGSIGNYDMRRIQAVVNVPVNDQVRLRFGVDRLKRDGYMKSISGIGPEDFNDTDYTALRASAVVDLTPELQNYTIFSYTNSTSHGPEPQIFLCNAGVALGGLACGQIARQNASGEAYATGNNQLDPHSSLHQWQLINTTTWDATNWLTVKNIVSYAHLKNFFKTNLFGDDFQVPGLGTLNFVAIDSPPGSAIADQTTFTEELQFQGHALDNRLTWQAGGYLEISKPGGPNHAISPTVANCTDIYTFQCLSGQVTDKPDAIDYRNFAGYAQATYALTDKLKLTGGLRYTNDRTRSWARVVNYEFTPGQPTVVACQSIFASLADGCFRQFSEQSAKPTWLIDLDYKPIQDVLTYVKYARGYRQGDVNPVAADGYNTWGPETVDSYEVGAKTSFRWPVPGSFDVAAFYNKFNNQQIFVGFQGPPPAVPNSSEVNAGKSRIWGIEAEATASPIRNLTIDLAYTYLNSKLEDLSPIVLIPATGYTIAQPSSVIGLPMALSPKNKLSLSADYTIPLEDRLGKVSFGATYVYTDPQLIIAGNPWGWVPAHGLLNLHADWKSIGGKPLDLSFFMTNVTNKFYWTNVTDLYETVGMVTRTLGEPRMFGVRLRARFGS